MARVHSTAQRGAGQGEGVRHVRLKLLMLSALCLVPGLGAAQMAWNGQSWLPLAPYPALSLISLLVYWQDKQQARSQTWRTPEKVLHASELCGGWPGALIAQQLFRHKTRKVSYQLVCWAIIALHQVFWMDYLFLGGHLPALIS